MPAANQPVQPEQDTFEVLYLQQRKKSQLLLIAVIVLSVATAGSLAWGVSKSNSPQPMPNGTPGQRFDSRQGGPGDMRRPGGGMRGMMNVKQFLKDDGSVDTDAVKSFVGRMPSGRGGSLNSSGFNFLDRFKGTIEQAAEDGDITKEQASALMQAFESESNANEG